jgi:hypothetical protein
VPTGRLWKSAFHVSTYFAYKKYYNGKKKFHANERKKIVFQWNYTSYYNIFGGKYMYSAEAKYDENRFSLQKLKY